MWVMLCFVRVFFGGWVIGMLGFLVFCLGFFFCKDTKCTSVLNMTFKNVQQSKVQYCHGRAGVHN